MYKTSVVIERDKFGYYAYCPELPGCRSQGETIEETMSRIREAAELYIETLSEEEREIYLSKEILTSSVEINVG